MDIGINREHYIKLRVSSNEECDLKEIRPFLHFALKLKSNLSHSHNFDDLLLLLQLIKVASKGSYSIGFPESGHCGGSKVLPKMSRINELWVTESQLIKTIETGKWFVDLRDHKYYTFLEDRNDHSRSILLERTSDGGILNVKFGEHLLKPWWVESCRRNRAIFRKLQRNYLKKMQRKK